MAELPVRVIDGAAMVGFATADGTTLIYLENDDRVVLGKTLAIKLAEDILIHFAGGRSRIATFLNRN